MVTLSERRDCRRDLIVSQIMWISVYVYQWQSTNISWKILIIPAYEDTSAGEAHFLMSLNVFPHSLAFCVYFGGHNILSRVMQHLMNVS